MVLKDINELVDDFLMSLPCRDPSPFPEVEVSEPNERYAKILLDAFADGTAAELTAIAQYFHHHLTIEEKAVSNLMLCIALVEMHHLEVIGDLIAQLGGDPKYLRANRGYWQGSEVSYGDSLIQKLRLDIVSEEAAIAAYHYLLAEIQDPKIQRIIERIIRDEQIHLMLFLEALKKYG